MMPHTRSAPYIIYTYLLLGQSWHVRPVIDGNVFFIFFSTHTSPLGLLKWAAGFCPEIKYEESGKSNIEVEAFTAFVVTFPLQLG